VRSVKQYVESILNATKGNGFSIKLVSTEKFGISHRGSQKLMKWAVTGNPGGRHKQVW
jgi:hypothetical protein